MVGKQAYHRRKDRKGVGLRILNHDRSGHPFQVQLSRELARREHHVLHSYATFFQTPKGALTKVSSDPINFDVIGISLERPFDKYALVRRWRQELEYSKRLIGQIREFHPDVVIMANTPPDAQAAVYRKCLRKDIKFVFWVQDLYGIAIDKILRRKLPLLGGIVGQYYMRLERRLLRQSDEVVLITDDFTDLMSRWGINEEKTHVIPNWAPLEEIPNRPKSNDWAKEQGLVDKFCFLYSGTLGMKHNPKLILRLAKHFAGNDDVRIIVVSEGLGADWLKEEKRKHDLPNMLIMDFLPFERFPDALGSADVLLAILEPEAGVFSVPSKVLSYLCAKRPLLLAVPPENLAARIVSQSEAGLVVHPTEVDAFVEAAVTLATNPSLCRNYAANAFAYAVKHFDIKTIGDKFEKIILN